MIEMHIPENVKLCESPGKAGGLPKCKLEKMVSDLPKDERAELVALVDLGIPGKSVKDWDSLLDNAKQTDGEGTARNLVGRGTFAYFIDQGLAKIQAKKN